MYKVVGGACVILLGYALVPGLLLVWLVLGVILIAFGVQERGLALRSQSVSTAVPVDPPRGRAYAVRMIGAVALMAGIVGAIVWLSSALPA